LHSWHKEREQLWERISNAEKRLGERIAKIETIANKAWDFASGARYQKNMDEIERVEAKLRQVIEQMESLTREVPKYREAIEAVTRVVQDASTSLRGMRLFDPIHLSFKAASYFADHFGTYDIARDVCVGDIRIDLSISKTQDSLRHLVFVEIVYRFDLVALELIVEPPSSQSEGHSALFDYDFGP